MKFRNDSKKSRWDLASDGFWSKKSIRELLSLLLLRHGMVWPFRQYIFGIFFYCLIFLLKITTFLKIKLLVPTFCFLVLSDKVSEFRQTVRQVLSGIQTIALPTL